MLEEDEYEVVEVEKEGGLVWEAVLELCGRLVNL